MSSWGRAITGTTSTSTRSIISRNTTTRVSRQSTAFFRSTRYRVADPTSHLQIPARKTSPTRKTLRTSANTTSKPTRKSAKNNSTACPLSSRTSPRSFAGTPNPPPHPRTFFFIMSVLCWFRFWDLAGQNFEVYYPLTYFVLYVSIVVMTRLAA